MRAATIATSGAPDAPTPNHWEAIYNHWLTRSRMPANCAGSVEYSPSSLGVFAPCQSDHAVTMKSGSVDRAWHFGGESEASIPMVWFESGWSDCDECTDPSVVE